jgi:hypothetical protein
MSRATIRQTGGSQGGWTALIPGPNQNVEMPLAAGFWTDAFLKRETPPAHCKTCHYLARRRSRNRLCAALSWRIRLLV